MGVTLKVGSSTGRRKQRPHKPKQTKYRAHATRGSSRVPKSFVPQIKHQNHNQTSVSFNSGATTGGDVLFTIPKIETGTEENARVGNKISGLTLRIYGTVLAKLIAADQGQIRIGVRLILCSPRKFPNMQDAKNNAAAWLPYVIDDGDVGTPLDGTTKSFFGPLNKDIIRVCRDKRMVLSQSYVGSTADNRQQTASTVRTFKWLVKVNKMLRYQQNASFYPDNAGLVLLVSYCKLDGSAPDTVTTNLDMAFRSDLWYRDA